MTTTLTPSDEHHALRGNLWKITAYSMCLHAMLPVPTIVLFWQSHGMNMTQVMGLQALFATAIVLLEVPSGYIADLIGRRKTLILAACANSCAIIAYSQGRGFAHFLIAELGGGLNPLMDRRSIQKSLKAGGFKSV